MSNLISGARDVSVAGGKPRVSIVCVFNDPNVLERCLIGSLRTQDEPFEWIPVDNTNGEFHSATLALNSGARRATSDFVVFVHQDVVFLERHSLRAIIDNLEKIGDMVGWVGVSGRDRSGVWRGLVRDRDFISGEPFDSFQEIQTLDELLLCTRRDEFCIFDESLSGWHAYGVDVCCSAIERGLRNYVVEASTWHASKALNTAKLKESHDFIYRKHHPKMGTVMTTCGRIPRLYQWKGGYRFFKLMQTIRWRKAFRRYSFLPKSKAVADFMDLLDELTLAYPRVGCLRGKSAIQHMGALGFRHKSSNPRVVDHYFDPSRRDFSGYDATIVFPEVLSEKSDRDEFRNFTIQIREVTRLKGCDSFENAKGRTHYIAEGLDHRMYVLSILDRQ